jgi:hypothetical protein
VRKLFVGSLRAQPARPVPSIRERACRHGVDLCWTIFYGCTRCPGWRPGGHACDRRFAANPPCLCGVPLVRFRSRKGNHSWFSSVRSVQAVKPSSEVVVSKADSPVGAVFIADRLDHLLHKHHYWKFFCCFVASVDLFLAVIRRHVPTVAGSPLEAQSVRLQASAFPVGTLVPVPTLWHFSGAGIGFAQRSCKAEGR